MLTLKMRRSSLQGGPIFGVTQSYTYDGANRLVNVNEANASNSIIWSQKNNYSDRFGNRWVSVPSGYPPSSLTPTAAGFFDTSTNRLTGANYGFDTQGNQTFISPYHLVYDAEGRMTSFSSTSNGSGAYGYDGAGRRVSKTINQSTTVFVYDALGKHIADYSNAPLGPDPCSPCFLTTDALGTIRAITSGTRNVSLHDYEPFGEELVTSNRAAALNYGVQDGVSQKFTGKERDVETGLDYFGFRYMSAAQGRLTSPDPLMASAKVWDLQTWNLTNNPLSRTDANAHVAADRAAVGRTLRHARMTSTRPASDRSADRQIATSLGAEGVCRDMPVVPAGAKNEIPARVALLRSVIALESSCINLALAHKRILV